MVDAVVMMGTIVLGSRFGNFFGGCCDCRVVVVVVVVMVLV